jgi:isoleucyl-tRNA synthetase
VPFEEICITSKIYIEEVESPLKASQIQGSVSGDEEMVISMEVASGQKCERCWRVLEEVGKSPAHPTLCVRCEDAVTHQHSAKVA